MNKPEAKVPPVLNEKQIDSSTPHAVAGIAMSGTVAQVEWAIRIRQQVEAEFDCVAASLRTASLKQTKEKRADTEAIIAILEQKRSEVLSRSQAGYFIHDWQEITDQVRQMILKDARYQAIKTRQLQHRRLPDT